jgi:hypothetical protein
MLPNGNFRPKQYSTYMLAKYHGTHVVPLIANSDYEGDINKKGDTVVIRKKPTIQTFPYTIGGGLKKQQALADDAIELSVDYGDYFNVPLNDIDAFMNDIDTQFQVMDEGAIALGDTIEQRVLQSIWASAGSIVTAPAVNSQNAQKFVRRCSLALNKKKIPKENRWMIIDPTFAYFLLGSELRLATTTGGSNEMSYTGELDKPISGFKLFMSHNLMADDTQSKIVFGHRDALAFAAKITKTETVRDTEDFQDLLRSIVCYGFKAVQEDALGCLDVTSFDDLNN